MESQKPKTPSKAERIECEKVKLAAFTTIIEALMDCKQEDRETLISSACTFFDIRPADLHD